MKKLILIAVCLFVFNLCAKAQYDYAEWGVGGSYGTTKPYADMNQNDTNKGYSVSIYWNYSPYLPFAFEAQTGTLSGGNFVTDPSHRFFVNKYLGFNLHADLQLGEITDFQGNFWLERLKGLYFGLGIGAIFNNITSIQRTALYDVPTYTFPGSDHTINALIPIRFGYEFKIYNYDNLPFMAVNLGYTHNLTFAEGLDGYDDPSSKFKNNSQDMFRTITVGVKFNFGNTVSYTKPIH